MNKLRLNKKIRKRKGKVVWVVDWETRGLAPWPLLSIKTYPFRNHPRKVKKNNATPSKLFPCKTVFPSYHSLPVYYDSLKELATQLDAPILVNRQLSRYIRNDIELSDILEKRKCGF